MHYAGTILLIIGSEKNQVISRRGLTFIHYVDHPTF